MRQRRPPPRNLEARRAQQQAVQAADRLIAAGASGPQRGEPFPVLGLDTGFGWRARRQRNGGLYDRHASGGPRAPPGPPPGGGGGCKGPPRAPTPPPRPHNAGRGVGGPPPPRGAGGGGGGIRAPGGAHHRPPRAKTGGGGWSGAPPAGGGGGGGGRRAWGGCWRRHSKTVSPDPSLAVQMLMLCSCRLGAGPYLAEPPR